MVKKITKIVDGGIITDDIVDRFQLRPFCSLNDVGNYISKFVGIVVTRTETLVSCPKHLGYKDDQDIELILGCMMKASQYLGMDNDSVLQSNIPYEPYLFVLDYFQKYGVYRENLKQSFGGYAGNIDWRRTARDSQKIISGINLIFLPLVINKSIQRDTFIGECMKFVINDGYEQFGKYVGRGLIIDGETIDINFENIDAVINQLQEEKNSHFKDLEIKLIDAIIDYLYWRGAFVENSFFITKKFEIMWETMVNSFLSDNYDSYDVESNRMLLVNGCKKHRFEKKTELIQSEHMTKSNGVGYSVEYDHFCKEGDVVTLFDSKYYNEIVNVNYKQIAYHYFLNNRFNKQEVPKQIINGLVIPFEGDYYSKIHLDRSDIDGVVIVEHYFNLRDVMKAYL